MTRATQDKEEPNTKETYTIQDLAAMTGLNERTIRGYLAGGQLQGSKVGGAWRFTPEQFDDFLGLRWAYRYRDGQARSILSGPPAALGELLSHLN